MSTFASVVTNTCYQILAYTGRKFRSIHSMVFLETNSICAWIKQYNKAHGLSSRMRAKGLANISLDMQIKRHHYRHNHQNFSRTKHATMLGMFTILTKVKTTSPERAESVVIYAINAWRAPSFAGIVHQLPS